VTGSVLFPKQLQIKQQSSLWQEFSIPAEAVSPFLSMRSFDHRVKHAFFELLSMRPVNPTHEGFEFVFSVLTHSAFLIEITILWQNGKLGLQKNRLRNEASYPSTIKILRWR